MPLFTFTGGADTGNLTEVTMYSVKFPVGVPVLVDDLFVVRKLRGMTRWFEEMPDGSDGGTVGGTSAPEGWPNASGSVGPAVAVWDYSDGRDSSGRIADGGRKPGRQRKRQHSGGNNDDNSVVNGRIETPGGDSGGGDAVD